MRHRKKGRTLGRTSAPRESLMRNLTASIILYERITTTVAKAKTVRSYVEKAITVGKKGDINARRELIRRVPVKNAVLKLIEEIGPRYKERGSGYTRIIKIGRRQGDNAEMARIELV